MSPVKIEEMVGGLYMGETPSAFENVGESGSVPADLTPREAYKPRQSTILYVRLKSGRVVKVEGKNSVAGGKVDGERLNEGEVKQLENTILTGLPKVEIGT